MIPESEDKAGEKIEQEKKISRSVQPRSEVPPEEIEQIEEEGVGKQKSEKRLRSSESRGETKQGTERRINGKKTGFKAYLCALFGTSVRATTIVKMGADREKF
eukprot:3180785-Rhodomonas_salina.2